MSFLVANLPPVHCFVRREFLYDFQSGHGEYEPCIWVSIKSLRSQAFRIESYLPRYGALYDKLPLYWRQCRESNPGLRFWRPQCYRNTSLSLFLVPRVGFEPTLCPPSRGGASTSCATGALRGAASWDRTRFRRSSGACYDHIS